MNRTSIFAFYTEYTTYTQLVEENKVGSVVTSNDNSLTEHNLRTKTIEDEWTKRKEKSEGNKRQGN